MNLIVGFFVKRKYVGESRLGKEEGGSFNMVVRVMRHTLRGYIG